MVIWIRRPQLAEDKDGEPIVNKDGSYQICEWAVKPERIIAPEVNFVSWLESIYKSGLVLLDKENGTGEFVPAGWLCQAQFDIPDGGKLGGAARAAAGL